MLLSGCPVLETLSLHLTRRSMYYHTGKFGKIGMPSSLKRLVFSDELDLEIEDLEIDTPCLEYLRIEIRTKCSRFSFKNLQNVVRAYLDFSPRDDYTDFMLKLLGALTRTKYLVMHLPTISTEVMCLV
ncbi:hypothetical protein RIF29_28860 [Crotalaria pallida]|uniref:Uncharacterized protein n=1 Tax=Crotalaria pallida TaxID=3830 RepID=A0AAN9EIN5_CROPI